MGSWRPQDDPPKKRLYHAPGAVPTIGELMRQGMGNWAWFHLPEPGLRSFPRDGLAPIAIKLGMHMPFDGVQELARCEECGMLGV
jgi:hypothetical protein